MGFVNDSTNKIQQLWATDASLLLVCEAIGAMNLIRCHVDFDGVPINMHGNWSVANSIVTASLIFGDTGSFRVHFQRCALTLDDLDISGFGTREGIGLTACSISVGSFNSSGAHLNVDGPTAAYSMNGDSDFYKAIQEGDGEYAGRYYGGTMSSSRVVGPLTVYIRTTDDDIPGDDTTGNGSAWRPFATLPGCYSHIAATYPNCFFVSLTLNMAQAPLP